MMKRLRGILAFLLVFVLFATMVPPVSVAAASDTADTTESQPAEAETVETTTPTEEAPPSETSPPTEETVPQNMEMDSYDIATASEDYGIMTAAATTGNVLLFDYTGYTITLNSQLGITYRPNGSSSSTTAYLKNIGWHYARYNNVAYYDDPIYCIEPNVNFGASTSYNSMDTGVTVSGSGYTSGASVWYAMPQSYRRAITLILLYSDQMWNDSYSVASTYRDSNPNTPLHLATQFLIYEIVMGIRDANTFEAWGNGYVDGDILYNAGCQVSNFAPNYNSLVAYVQGAMKLPSFVGSSTSNAPTIDLEESLTWLHDDNGVLSNFTFPGDDTVNFNIYGDDMCVEPLGTISSSKVYSCYRSIPSSDSSTVALYYDSASSYQTCVKLYSPSSSYLYGYFKLNQPVTTGNMNIIKTTSDGQNLSGWKFSLYFDSACTRLFAGPYTTSSSGRISFTGTTPGSYYIREEGHTDPAIEAKYTCTSANPQKITVVAGETSSVTFNNTLKPGTLNLVKSTSDGQNLAGWQFNIYSNSSCITLISGPHTTDSSGKLSVSLSAGTVYVREIGHQDSSINSRYTCTGINPQTVVINHGGTSTVTFHNTLSLGRIEIQKTTNTGKHLDGWVFRITDSDGDEVVELVTDENGYAISEELPAGRYLIQELYTDDDYWQITLGGHDVVVKAGETSVDEWYNVEQGLARIYKRSNTGKSVEGWEITIYSDEACTQEIYTLTTNEDGYAGYYISPGTYWAKETGDTEGRFDSEYWLVDERVQKFEVKPHEDVSIEFNNIHYGKLKVIKTMDTEGSVEGWKFKVTDANGKEITGSPFITAADGTILTGNLLPGKYTVEELIPKDSPYICVSENPQTVTVVQGEIAEVAFTNAMVPAKIIVTKVDIGNKPLAGAKFLLEWSEDGILWWPVTFSDEKVPVQGYCNNPDVEDGCLISGEDGILEWDNLHPSVQYRLTELEAPEGYVLLEDYAYEGTIPTRDYTLKLRVINCHGFTLPDTGSDSMRLVQLFTVLAYAALIFVSVWDIRRKELR